MWGLYRYALHIGIAPSALISALFVSSNSCSNILGTMRRELLTRIWAKHKTTGFLPFKNGVLEIATGKFYDHNPDFRLTWQLPRN
ncbi:MAG: hypothetical protein ACFBSE_26660, partial [Prochloraceae cyanobacterium]